MAAWSCSPRSEEALETPGISDFGHYFRHPGFCFELQPAVLFVIVFAPTSRKPAVFGLLATFDLEELVVVVDDVVVMLFDNFDSLFCTVFWQERTCG